MLIATLFACVVPPQPEVVAPAVDASPVLASAPSAAPHEQPVAAAPVAAPVIAGLGVVPPDFTLVDRNPKSPGNGQPVSPKDYVGSAAGFYFTHAT